MKFDASELMDRMVRRKISEEHAQMERCISMMLYDCMTSVQAHTAALGQGHHPGIGWWTIVDVLHRDGQPPKLRMRYVWPYKDDAKRAREAGNGA